MITSQGALEDYDEICKMEKLSAEEKVVLIMKVVIKLLLGIRTNQRGGVKRPEPGQPVVQDKE